LFSFIPALPLPSAYCPTASAIRFTRAAGIFAGAVRAIDAKPNSAARHITVDTANTHEPVRS